MIQPTAEAYEAGAAAWRKGGGLIAIADAVWPLAVAEGRRLEAERLAPLVEAAEAVSRGIGGRGDGRLLRLRAAVDALIQED